MFGVDVERLIDDDPLLRRRCDKISAVVRGTMEGCGIEAEVGRPSGLNDVVMFGPSVGPLRAVYETRAGLFDVWFRMGDVIGSFFTEAVSSVKPAVRAVLMVRLVEGCRYRSFTFRDFPAAISYFYG